MAKKVIKHFIFCIYVYPENLYFKSLFIIPKSSKAKKSPFFQSQHSPCLAETSRHRFGTLHGLPKVVNCWPVMERRLNFIMEPVQWTTALL